MHFSVRTEDVQRTKMLTTYPRSLYTDFRGHRTQREPLVKDVTGHKNTVGWDKGYLPQPPVQMAFEFHSGYDRVPLPNTFDILVKWKPDRLVSLLNPLFPRPPPSLGDPRKGKARQWQVFPAIKFVYGIAPCITFPKWTQIPLNPSMRG